jgi:hypothetical protein
MLAYGFNSSVGTNLTIANWYYMHPAISWIDIIIFINFIFLLIGNLNFFKLRVSNLEKKQIYLICMLSGWLIIATSVNSFRFEVEFSSIFPSLKLLYYIIVMYIVKSYAEVYGIVYLVVGFFIGVVAFVLQSFIEAQVYMYYGIPILWNPNVVGMTIGMGIMFAALLVVLRLNIVMPLFFIILFSIFSTLTWSKGAWIVSVVGITIAMMGVFHNKKYNLNKLWLIIFLISFAFIIYLNFDYLSYILERKTQSTENIQSVGFRFKMILLSIYTSIHNPFFGLGYDNFYQAQVYSEGLGLQIYGKDLNAHNAFFQILAVGGIPAFVFFIFIFTTPFLILRKVLLFYYLGKIKSIVVTLIFAGIMFVFANTQLQIISQPVFWFFCGIIFSIYSSSLNSLMPPFGSKVQSLKNRHHV